MARIEVRGRRIDSGDAVAIEIDDGVIMSISSIPSAVDLPWIGPGLVDLQVNGYAGFDFNADAIAPDEVAALCRALAGVGITTFLPTVITADPVAIEQRIRAVRRGIAADPFSAGMIAGIHLEGPFISPEDGARGAHPLGDVCAPDWSLFERWQSAAEGTIRVVTLSPEWPEAATFIERLRAAGVIPAIGHTAATPEQIRAAVAAGARLSTHLGNGAHAMLPRHPNYLWEQLAADDLWASFMADGFHLPDSVMKIIMRMKGSRAMLVSDSVALAGMPPGNYQTGVGSEVVLTPEGRLHLASDPRLLAGSAQSMLWGVSRLVRSGLASLADAWAMASLHPATLLGIPQQRGLAIGAPADLVTLEPEIDEVLRVRQVVRAGDVVSG